MDLPTSSQADNHQARTDTVSQYPVPPTQNDQGEHDFAQTAAAALLSAQPEPIQRQQQAQPLPVQMTPPINIRKRKPAPPGSRGVANLTPEQLSKKRANDREAQRAIRERTKSHIEGLEARIAELENQSPYQEVQRALQERDRALAECEELRKRLAAVAGIVGSQNIGQSGLSQLAALTAQQPPLPSLSEQQPQQHSEPPVQHLHPDLRSSAEHDGMY